jgi:DNA-binding CsgD family transcriptional regulator
MADIEQGTLSAVRDDAMQVWDIAVRTGDFAMLVTAAYACTSSDVAGYRAFAEIFRRAQDQLTAMGSPHTHISEMCAQEASDLLTAGDWRTCLARLRVALGARPGVLADGRARLVGALLACRQGRQAEAEAHFARAEELFGERLSFTVFALATVHVELAVAAGDIELALSVATAALRQTVTANETERILPLAARALADRATTLRDRGADPAAALDRLRALRREFGDAIAGDERNPRFYQLFLAAQRELVDAEQARAVLAADETTRWRRAAEACRSVGEPWNEAYCRWREAAALARHRSKRRDAAAALQAAYAMAVDLQAVPLMTELEALARGGRFPLSVAAPESAAAADAIPGLTAREREILRFIVAGHTYSEIARTLFLSEKTVGVHVSNMLRKTGAANRGELSQLAHRLDSATTGR